MESVLVTLQVYRADKNKPSQDIDDIDNGPEVDFEVPLNEKLSDIITYLADNSVHVTIPKGEYLIQKLNHTRNPTLDLRKSLLENEQAHPELAIYDGDTLLVVEGNRRYETPLAFPSDVDQPTLQCVWSGVSFPLGYDVQEIKLGTDPVPDPETKTIHTDLLLEGTFTVAHQARITRNFSKGGETWYIYDGWAGSGPSMHGTVVKFPLIMNTPSRPIFPIDAVGVEVLSDTPTQLRDGYFICLGEKAKRGPVLRFLLPRS